MERLEKIRVRLVAHKQGEVWRRFSQERRDYIEHVGYLLEHIEELEKENKRLRSYEKAWVAENYGES